MAYRELGMIELREVVRRWQAGDGFRAIARGTRIDRKTVARYVQAAGAIGLVRGGAPPSDEQIAAVRQHLMGELAPALSAEMQALAPHREQIRAWLTADQLRLTKIYRRLREQHVDVSYSTLYRFARAQCDFGRPALTVRVADPPPGEAAEVDFGRLGRWLDPETGRRRTVSGLLVTLCFSRYAFLWVSLARCAPCWTRSTRCCSWSRQVGSRTPIGRCCACCRRASRPCWSQTRAIGSAAPSACCPSSGRRRPRSILRRCCLSAPRAGATSASC